MNSGSLPDTFSTPRISARLFSGRAMSAPAAFAQSIADPPPTAIMQSHPSFAYMSAAARALETVGLTTVSEYTAHSMPASDSEAISLSHSPSPKTFLSVTTSALRMPRETSSPAASSVPCRRRGCLYGRKGRARRNTA